MEHAPDVDMVVSFDIEDEVGKPAEPPAPETLKIIFVGETGRTGSRPLTYRAVGGLKRFGKGSSHVLAGLKNIMIRDFVHVPLGRDARDKGLHARLAARSAIRLRSLSK